MIRYVIAAAMAVALSTPTAVNPAVKSCLGHADTARDGHEAGEQRQNARVASRAEPRSDRCCRNSQPDIVTRLTG
jgi:hypothetical protein